MQPSESLATYQSPNPHVVCICVCALLSSAPTTIKQLDSAVEDASDDVEKSSRANNTSEYKGAIFRHKTKLKKIRPETVYGPAQLRESVVLHIPYSLLVPGGGKGCVRVIRRGFMERVGFSFMMPAASAFCFVELISAQQRFQQRVIERLIKKHRVVFVACTLETYFIYWSIHTERENSPFISTLDNTQFYINHGMQISLR
jgi:hypothetical protein